MRRLVSSASALEADRRAEADFGYPPLMLMEEAGIRLQDRLETLVGTGPVVYLVGPGNNGGDAWVMARHSYLRGRRDLCVLRLVPAASASCQRQEKWGLQVGVPVLNALDEAEALLKAASVWVDGLWGAGLRGPLRAEAATLIAELEERRSRWSRRVAAVDVPSGMHEARAATEPVLNARWTLSPGPLKDFCFFPSNREASGEPVEVALSFPLGAEANAFLYEESDLAALVPPVSPAAHKGQRGHVALAGGAPGMTGALVLAARCAAAAGAGLITLAAEDALIPLIAPQVPAFQVRQSAPVLHDSRYDAWVVGPGWGQTSDRTALLQGLWSTAVPLVVDADAIAAWSKLGQPRRDAPTVLTPHPGEFVRLSVGGPTVENAQKLAIDRGVTVVLKGAVTWVLSPDGRRAAWDGLEPALGTGGSGDCLAGVVAAFLATGMESFEAAVAAVALHGTSGRALASDEGWFTADRLPPMLSRVALACRTAARPL